ncbi:hypothetical protein [Bacillus sp. FJAT-29937]|uniref:hypothetical protein n=1 Tax=Bacillus sp. FJAT-29937 TaxID=1720553 RepID=UPI000833A04A|nr:hypothetical protein [Bacillus sp. FJAT-29937]
MGSASRWSAIKRFISKHEEDLLKEYSFLIGRKILSVAGVDVNYYVSADIILSDERTVTSHYRWSSEEENYEGIELDSEFKPLEEYYEENLIGKTITHIKIGSYRDDEVYVLAFIAEDEKHCLEIPLGVDPECVDSDGNVIER